MHRGWTERCNARHKGAAIVPRPNQVAQRALEPHIVIINDLNLVISFSRGLSTDVHKHFCTLYILDGFSRVCVFFFVACANFVGRLPSYACH